VLRDVRRLVLRCLEGEGDYEAVLLATSGTGAVEAMLGAADGPVLVIANGRYSRRMADIARAVGHDVATLQADAFAELRPEVVEEALRRRPDVRTLAFVHCETTTGLLTPLAGMCAVAAANGVATAVDAIGSAGAHDVHLRRPGPDWLVVTSGKAVEGPAGLSFVVGRHDRLTLGPVRRHGFSLDLFRHWECQRRDAVASTVPVPLVVTARAALSRWAQEGTAARRARYAATAGSLRNGLLARGFQLVPLPAAQRSNVVIPVRLPVGLDFALIRDQLLESGLEIYHAPETIAQGYFFLAALGCLDAGEIGAFLDALASSCRAAGAAGAVLGGTT